MITRMIDYDKQKYCSKKLKTYIFIWSGNNNTSLQKLIAKVYVGYAMFLFLVLKKETFTGTIKLSI